MKNSREGLLEREREVLRLIELFKENNLRFIVVGGYAVSTYKKRFSIDLDAVILEEDLLKFEKLLLNQGYAIGYEKKIALLYGENFKRFTKKMNNLPVDVDLLINGLVSRTTNSTWSFENINENSVKRKVDNIDFLTPIKELLISMKMHSGRLSDTRDIVALMPCDKDKLRRFLLRGNLNSLKNSIAGQLSFLEKPQFDDSFKGIFGIQVYDERDVEFAKKIFGELLGEISELTKG
ncbi:nucleotidyltransferase family protein [Candidatus Pacearchaeota archaeon]|nr:nucleotidyltransferase family protein [Candidatus Pacearchaeota archaeon]